MAKLLSGLAITLLFSSLLAAPRAVAQVQPIFCGVMCYSLEDVREVIQRMQAIAADDARKAYWDAKKASGRCFFIQPAEPSRTPQFHVEDSNVGEVDGPDNTLLMFVRGRIGGRTDPMAYSCLQMQRR